MLATTPTPSCDNQKCFLTLPNAPWWGKSPPHSVENHYSKGWILQQIKGRAFSFDLQDIVLLGWPILECCSSSLTSRMLFSSSAKWVIKRYYPPGSSLSYKCPNRRVPLLEDFLWHDSWPNLKAQKDLGNNCFAWPVDPTFPLCNGVTQAQSHVGPECGICFS